MSAPPDGAPEATPERGGNLRALGMIQVFRLASGLAINVSVMRGLGVEGFGVYGYVTTLVGLASFGATLGMDRLLKREIARDERLVGHYVATGLAASALLSLVTLLGIVGWAWAVDGRGFVVVAAAVAALALSLQSLALVPVSTFHAVRRMNLGVLGNAAGRATLVVATLLFLALHLGVVAVYAAQVLDALVTLFIVWHTYRRHLGDRPLVTTWPDVRGLIRTSFPFGMNALFVSIYLSVDVLLLAEFKGDAEVGLYRGAVMLLSLFPIVADTLSTGLYPRMARHLGDRAAAGAELHFATRVLLAISVPAAVGGVLTAGPLMVFLGGPAFGASAPLFAVMAPLLPLRYLNNGYGMVLSALNRQEDRTRGAILAAVVNIGANLALMPRYGAMAAAGNTLLTEVILVIWMRARIVPLVSGVGLVETLARVGVPAAVMAAVLLMLPPMHVLLSIAVGGTVYAALGLATGAWHPRDLTSLRRV